MAYIRSLRSKNRCLHPYLDEKDEKKHRCAAYVLLRAETPFRPYVATYVPM